MLVWIIFPTLYLAWYFAYLLARRVWPARQFGWASETVARRMNTLGAITLFLLMPAHLILSEIWWGKHIHPHGITTVADYYARFGDPRRIRAIERDGATTYHLHGDLPPDYVLALPSEPPVYVFDQTGRYLEWCRDPGDGPGADYWPKWPRGEGREVNLQSFREQFRVGWH